MNEQFPAPQAEDMLIHGAMHKNGNVDFRHENGRFMSKADVAAISANLPQQAVVEGNPIEADAVDFANIDPQTAEFSWDEVKTELDTLDDKEPGVKDFLVRTAAHVKKSVKSGKPIQGTGEYEPDVTSYIFTRKDADGKETTEEVPFGIGRKLEALAAEDKKKKAADAFAQAPTGAADASIAAPEVVSTDTPEAPKAPESASPEEPKAPEAFAAPNAEDMLIDSYVNAEGDPLGTRAGLLAELSRKVEAGDDSDIASLYMALRDASVYEELLKNDGRTEEEIIQDLDKHFNAQLLILDVNAEASNLNLNEEEKAALLAARTQEKTGEDTADKDADSSTKKPGRARRAYAAAMTSAGTRISGAGSVEEGGKDKSKRRRFALGAAAGIVAVGVSAFLFHKYGMHHSGPKGDVTAHMQPNGTGGAGSGVASGAAEGSAQAAASAAAEAAARAPAATFTVVEKWHAGAPTAWSWAHDLGVPNSRIPNFLNDTMGANWAETARSMQIGDSISATAEQIAQYTQAG